MASLRRKPADVVVASVDAAQPVAIGIDTSPSPAPAPAPSPVPEPLTPLSDASGALKHQLEALQNSETLSRQQAAVLTAEGRRREWLQGNPIAQKHFDHLGAFHNEAIQSGLTDTSPDYFQHMENRLAALHGAAPTTVGTHLIEEMQARTAQERAPPPQPERPRTNIVSAPVSREVPTAAGPRQNGKTTLSKVEQEYARIAGVSETEYAKQKMRLEALKESGQYTGGQ